MKLNSIYKCIYFFCGVILFIASATGVTISVINPPTGNFELTPMVIGLAIMSLGLFAFLDVLRSKSLFGEWLINKTGNLVLAIMFMGTCIFTFVFLSYLQAPTYLIFSSVVASLIASFAAQATFLVPLIAAPLAVKNQAATTGE
jgi:hypothetical protein